MFNSAAAQFTNGEREPRDPYSVRVMASEVVVDGCLVFALVEICRMLLRAIAGCGDANRNAVTVDAVATQAAIIDVNCMSLKPSMLTRRNKQ